MNSSSSSDLSNAESSQNTPSSQNTLTLRVSPTIDPVYRGCVVDLPSLPQVLTKAQSRVAETLFYLGKAFSRYPGTYDKNILRLIPVPRICENYTPLARRLRDIECRCGSDYLNLNKDANCLECDCGGRTYIVGCSLYKKVYKTHITTTYCQSRKKYYCDSCHDIICKCNVCPHAKIRRFCSCACT